MSPYRNTGWVHFEKMLDILPLSTARGDGRFSAIGAAPPTPAVPAVVHDNTEPVGTPGAGIMDVDQNSASALGSSTLISTAPQKRKVLDDGTDGSASAFSRAPPMSSSGLSVASSVPDSDMPSVPSKRRKSAMPLPSTLPSSHQAASSKKAVKVSTDIMMHNIQSSINALTSSLTTGMSADPPAETMQRAVNLISSREDGLDDDDRVLIVELFTSNPPLAHAYLGLTSESFRRLWLKKALERERKRVAEVDTAQMGMME